MRKTLAALMFAAALPTVAMAMPQGDAPMGSPMGSHFGAEHRHSPYSQLDLSPEQRQKIGHIMGEQMKGREMLIRDYLKKLSPADQKALKDELAARKAKAHSEIRGLLTPDQQKRFDEIQKKQAEKRAEWEEFKAWKAQHPSKAQ